LPRRDPADYDGSGMRDYRYAVDRDGRIFHDGSEITDPAVLRFFLRVMQRTPEGGYLALCQGERNWFETADTPFVIQRLRWPGGDPIAVELCFAGDYHEALDPATLEADDGQLYCRVRGGALRARFGRVALQQLGPHLVEADGGASLMLGDRRHPIREPAALRQA
jgi:hypothetical protein